MRSFVVKAALAALLISTPLTTAFAASTHDGGTSETHMGSDHFRSDNPNRFGGEAREPGPFTYAPNGQLDAILNDLGDANARIASDRSQGVITPAQAYSMRLEERTIRREAIADNAMDGGKIPMGQYEQLMAQVENLQSQL